MRRRARHWIVTAIGAVLLATALLVFAFPKPLFAHRVSAGRLTLYSDRPFDASRARVILGDVAARLATSPLDDGRRYSIFVANDEWRRALFFTVAGAAAGVNYAPLTDNVFIRRSDIDHDTVYGASGRPAPPPRTFTYFAAHEIAHSLTSRRLGPARLWNHGLPQWVREGYADYVGLGGKVELETLYRRYRAGDPDLDFNRSHTYARFRMLTAYMLEREHWSVDRLLATRLTEAQALALMDAGMAPGVTASGRTAV